MVVKDIFMETTGKILKESRLKKNITLDTIAKKLNISVYYLNAIEDGIFAKTPGEPYTSGFIRSYSNFLDLDTEFIFKIYKDETKQKKEKQEIYLPITQNKNHFIYLKFGFGSFIVASFFYVFYNFFYVQTNIEEMYAITPQIETEMIALVEEEDLKRSLNKIKKFKKENKINESMVITKIPDAPLTIKPKLNNTHNINTAIANINNETTNSIKNKILIRTIDDTWINIRDSKNQLIISKLMKKNEEFYLNSSPYYFITTGNAGNIEVLIDNKKIGKLGKKGEVLNAFQLSENFKNN